MRCGVCGCVGCMRSVRCTSYSVVWSVYMCDVVKNMPVALDALCICCEVTEVCSLLWEDLLSLDKEQATVAMS